MGRRLRVSEIAVMTQGQPTPPTELDPAKARSWADQLELARAANDLLLEEACARVRNGDRTARTASLLSMILGNVRTGMMKTKSTDDPARMTDEQLREAAGDTGSGETGTETAQPTR